MLPVLKRLVRNARKRSKLERKLALEADHWRDERAYWRERIRDWYREQYGLALHPIQDDASNVPPAELVDAIQKSGKANPDTFLATGARTMLSVLEELRDHGADPRRFERILEFGVGLGRLIRHLYPLPAELHGCDVTDGVVAFTRATHGDRVQLARSELAPPLPYPEAHFDFVYANSVFTHIQTDHLHDWIDELARVTRPGGWVIVSVYGDERYLGHLAERDYDRMRRGPGYLEWGAAVVKQNFLYAREDKLREWWGRRFDVLELRRLFKDQDQLVLRRHQP